MNIDPISDFLTRLRNAISANHRIVDIPHSKMKLAMTKILFEKGYILQYKTENEGTIESSIKIALKYHPTSKMSAIKELKRVSKPGLRVYKNANELPRVLNGLGIAVISTSQGVMTDKECQKNGIGGEILCYVS